MRAEIESMEDSAVASARFIDNRELPHGNFFSWRLTATVADTPRVEE